MQVEVRLLGPDDLDLLLEADPDVFDLPCRRDRAEAFLAEPRHHIAGAIEGGRLVGMATALDCLRPDKPPERFIAEVGVAARLHRRGIGLRLVRLMVEHGRALGCASAWVATELDNAPARAFYRAAGGVPDDQPAEVFTFAPDRAPADAAGPR
jgi:ribosomal protein S18 acetylase RimI-like enzyme